MPARVGAAVVRVLADSKTATWTITVLRVGPDDLAGAFGSPPAGDVPPDIRAGIYAWLQGAPHA